MLTNLKKHNEIHVCKDKQSAQKKGKKTPMSLIGCPHGCKNQKKIKENEKI